MLSLQDSFVSIFGWHGANTQQLNSVKRNRKMEAKRKVHTIEDVVKTIRLFLARIHCFGAFHVTEISKVVAYNSKLTMRQKKKQLALPHQDKKPQSEDRQLQTDLFNDGKLTKSFYLRTTQIYINGIYYY